MLQFNYISEVKKRSAPSILKPQHPHISLLQIFQSRQISMVLVLKYEYSIYKLNKQNFRGYFQYSKTNKQSVGSQFTAYFDIHIKETCSHI